MEPNDTVTKFKVQRKIHSENLRLYFSRFELTEMVEPGFRGVTMEYQNPILEALMAIPGVEAATIYPYHVVIQKAMAFDWDELEGAILRLITSFHLALPSPEFLDSENLPDV